MRSMRRYHQAHLAFEVSYLSDSLWSAPFEVEPQILWFLRGANQRALAARNAIHALHRDVPGYHSWPDYHASHIAIVCRRHHSAISFGRLRITTDVAAAKEIVDSGLSLLLLLRLRGE
jgi:hypothetical protein